MPKIRKYNLVHQVFIFVLTFFMPFKKIISLFIFCSSRRWERSPRSRKGFMGGWSGRAGGARLGAARAAAPAGWLRCRIGGALGWALLRAGAGGGALCIFLE